jgi:hypothetical protein
MRSNTDHIYVLLAYVTFSNDSGYKVTSTLLAATSNDTIMCYMHWLVSEIVA